MMRWMGLGLLMTLVGMPAVSADSPSSNPTDETAVLDAPAESVSPTALAFFESKIRPALIEHCYDCHSEESGAAEGGLRLDTREAIRAGGDRGPAVVPGDHDKSLLLAAITHAEPQLRMPPQSPQLPATVIANFKQWIEMGAPDPRQGEVAKPKRDNTAAEQHWAYQPLVDPPVPGIVASPTSPGEAWPRRDLDRFILAALQTQGLEPSADAEPAKLLRRLHFDLVGLPPRPVDWQRFEQRIAMDGIEAALQAEVDRLLASPQFGERWGRHWLDVARFGESSGNEANISFPYAWRYRDYVIDAFNRDVPYDRFLLEQIAGDLLPAADAAERARLLIATGFLALGPKNLDESNAFQFLADLIDEQIDSVTQAVLASTIACARCHDHKFDPFSMRDYYALAGVFASTETFFGTAVSPANRVGGKPLVLPIDAGQVVLHDSISAERVKQLEAERAELQHQEQVGRQAVREAIAAGKDPSGLFTLTDALRIFWRTGAIDGQLQKVSATGQALPLCMGVLERSQMLDVPLLQRGEINRPGETVPRGMPRISASVPTIEIPQEHSGRLEFVQWLTHPEHPLTSRVLVNRVWQHLFGAGLVRTVDNFGTTGESPSHPELLDHLALRFMQEGWSIKQLIRELTLSRAYRQSSEHREAAFLRDPDNRLLWRAAKRRLAAEEVRDAMLLVSGELNLQRPVGSLVGRVIGDRPISLIGLDKRLPSDLDGMLHRSVYLPVIRDRLPDVLELFDFAEPSLVTGQRETTTVPTQALFLMNSEFVQDRAAMLAVRLLEQSDDAGERIRTAFQWCYNRLPDQEEQRRCRAFLEEMAIEPSPKIAATAAGEAEKGTPPLEWVSFCQALLLTAEFQYLD